MLGQNDDEDDLREVHSQTREADSDCFKTAPAYWGMRAAWVVLV